MWHLKCNQYRVDKLMKFMMIPCRSKITKVIIKLMSLKFYISKVLFFRKKLLIFSFYHHREINFHFYFFIIHLFPTLNPRVS